MPTPFVYNALAGMFKHDEETRTVWFDPDSFEANIQFQLIGSVRRARSARAN